MSRVAILFFSGSGHTSLMADAVAHGAAEVPGTIVSPHRIEPRDLVDGRYTNEALLAGLADADAIIFGTPTYMGGPAAQFKAFADATGGIWYHRGWKDKLAAGFTHSSSPAGDKLATLQYLSVFAAQHGMLWVGQDELSAAGTGLNRTGAYLGAAGHGNGTGDPQLDPGDARTAEALGRRVAQAAARLAPAELAARI